MVKYRKKPVVIEAVKYTKENKKEAFKFVYPRSSEQAVIGFISMNLPFIIETLEGNMEVSLGDFIIKGTEGEFYPCKPDIFEKTYEIV